MTGKRNFRRRGGRKRWLVLVWAGSVTVAFSLMLIVIVMTDMTNERGSVAAVLSRIVCGFRHLDYCPG